MAAIEGECKPKEPTRTNEILARLVTLREYREKTINCIGVCVNKIQNITEPPNTKTDSPKRDSCFLSTVEEHLDILDEDNGKLSLILETLQKII